MSRCTMAPTCASANSSAPMTPPTGWPLERSWKKPRSEERRVGSDWSSDVCSSDLGVVMDVEMHDGSHLRIRKLERTYDPTNRLAAGAILEEAEIGRTSCRE